MVCMMRDPEQYGEFSDMGTPQFNPKLGCGNQVKLWNSQRCLIEVVSCMYI